MVFRNLNLKKTVDNLFGIVKAVLCIAARYLFRTPFPAGGGGGWPWMNETASGLRQRAGDDGDGPTCRADIKKRSQL